MVRPICFLLTQEEGATPKVELNNSRSHSVKKASSTPAINELEKKSKKILVSLFDYMSQ